MKTIYQFSLVLLIVATVFFGCSNPNSPQTNGQKSITSFEFRKSINPTLPSDISGTIIGTRIEVTVPETISVNTLIATFVSTGKAVTIDSKPQTSGTTVNDFSQAVVYRVTAEDNSVVDYTVTVRRVAEYKPITLQFTGYTWDSTRTDSDLFHDVFGAYVDNRTLYVFTSVGLAVSTNGGRTWRYITDKNGLSSNTIYCMLIHDGVMYIGTDNGLNVSKDGGNTFITWTTANGLSDNAIRYLKVYNGELYVGTENMVSVTTDGTSWRILGANFQEKKIRGIYYDGSRLYIGTTSGMYISTDMGNTFTRRKFPTNLSIVSDIEGYSDTLYVGTTEGLMISKDGGTTIIPKTNADGLAADFVNDIAIDPDGNLYVVSIWGDLSISNDGGSTWHNKTTDDGIVDSQMCAVSYFNGSLYIATSGGLSVSTDHGNTFSNYYTKNAIPAEYVYDVATRGGKIYIATDAGLAVSADGGMSWRNYTMADGLVANFLTCLAVTDTAIYVGTTKGVSISYDDCRTWTHRLTYDKTSDNKSFNVNHISVKGGKSYAGTFDGLLVSDDDFATYSIKTTASGLGANQVNSICVTDGAIYVATNNGMSISRDSGNTFSNERGKLNHPYIYDVLAQDGAVYVCTYYSLNVSTDDCQTFTKWVGSCGNDSYACNSAIQIHDSIFYLATMANGLYVTNNQGSSYFHFNENNGMVSDGAYRLLIADNHLYVAGQGGLSIAELH